MKKKDTSNAPAVISVDHVSKRFLLPHERKQSVKSIFTSIFREKNTDIDVQKALQDISFEVKKGEFFGIVGRNGSGKSTLLKILAGIYQPTGGSIERTGKLIPFIELGVGFNPELTGRENVYLNGSMLGFSQKQIDGMYKDIVEFAELERFMDQKLKNYSSGMQVRLAFSMATRAKADILLVDEVLAVGDADFQRKCYDYFRKLKKTDTTIVFVTHDMNAVKTFCDRAILIEKGLITSQGSANEVAEEYLQLFNGDTKKTVKTVEYKKDGKGRWGTGDVKMDDVSIETNNKEITVTIDLKSHDKDIEEFVVGYNFKTGDGDILMGGNNLNAASGSQKLSMNKHSTKKLTFTTPNFLGTGEYILEATVRDASNLIFDRWEDIASVKITKAESYYPTIAYADLEVIDGKPA